MPRRPLSYSAISHYESCGYRFQLERVFGFGREIAIAGPDGEPWGPRPAKSGRPAAASSIRCSSGARRTAGARRPTSCSTGHAAAEGLDGSERDCGRACARQLPAGSDSALLRERVSAESTRVRAEVPLLLSVEGSILRGSIDLLVERDGVPPLVVDLQDRPARGASPAEHVGRLRDPALDLRARGRRGSLDANEVEVAYVFLERPDEPQIASLGAPELEAARARLAEVVARIGGGEFPVAPPDRRSGNLCRGCPALGRVCSGPVEASSFSASSSRRSSLRPSPTASSSVEQ